VVDGNENDSTSDGPICPNCRQPLRDRLRQEEVTPKTVDVPGSGLAMTIVFCGSCGWTLDVVPARTAMQGRFATARAGIEEVAAPQDGESLAGQFQIRCRDLVTETRKLGFNPNVWVPMINSLGALGAAKKLLSDHHVLVATPWLVERGHAELTLEHEIEQMRWADLFDDAERVEAARRLAAAGNTTSD